MIITGWNVNSLNVRLPQVLQYLSLHSPDVLGLQELKQTTDAVKTQAFTQIGYYPAVFGQKTYNGVALLARRPPEDIVSGIPGFADEQSRAIAATVAETRILNLYVPNGKAVGDEKYAYKLRWLDAVIAYIDTLCQQYPRVVIIGDFNIAPADIDVHDSAALQDKILCSSPERAALQRLFALGFQDAFRVKYPDKQQFSWWDYRMGGLRRNLGLRIDLTLCSRSVGIRDAGIHIEPRRWQRPSDHAPVWVETAD